MQLVLVVLILFGIYLVGCQIWPHKACPRCSGGKHPSLSGQYWRHCSRCGGTGRRRRFFAADH